MTLTYWIIPKQMFFGYPHRPLTTADLEEQIFRLLSLKEGLTRYKPGHMARLARSLVETIYEVNSAFIQTKMVIRAILVDIVSTHEDPAQRVGGSERGSAPHYPSH